METRPLWQSNGIVQWQLRRLGFVELVFQVSIHARSSPAGAAPAHTSPHLDGRRRRSAPLGVLAPLPPTALSQSQRPGNGREKKLLAGRAPCWRGKFAAGTGYSRLSELASAMSSSSTSTPTPTRHEEARPFSHLRPHFLLLRRLHDKKRATRRAHTA